MYLTLHLQDTFAYISELLSATHLCQDANLTVESSLTSRSLELFKNSSQQSLLGRLALPSAVIDLLFQHFVLLLLQCFGLQGVLADDLPPEGLVGSLQMFSSPLFSSLGEQAFSPSGYVLFEDFLWRSCLQRNIRIYSVGAVEPLAIRAKKICVVHIRISSKAFSGN